MGWKRGTSRTNVVLSTPAIGVDGTIFEGSLGKVYALNPDGTFKWSTLGGGMGASSPAIGVDGTIYVGSHDSRVYAFRTDGTLKWVHKTGSGTRGVAPASAPGSMAFRAFL
jgi:outer membrane protein assembly factor BamB